MRTPLGIVYISKGAIDWTNTGMPNITAQWAAWITDGFSWNGDGTINFPFNGAAVPYPKGLNVIPRPSIKEWSAWSTDGGSPVQNHTPATIGRKTDLMRHLLAAIILSLFTHPALAAPACNPIAEMLTTTPVPPQTFRGLERATIRAGQQPDDAEFLFIGDSLVDQWAKYAPAQFGEASVFNFANSGDRVQNVLWRLSRMPVTDWKPTAIVTWIGTNNLPDREMPACGIFAGISRLLAEMHSRWPDAPVFILEIPPRGPDFKAYDTLRLELNALIHSLPGTTKNVFPVALDEEALTCGGHGKPRLEPKAGTPALTYACDHYQKGNLHFTQAGYTLIRKALSAASIAQTGADLFSR